MATSYKLRGNITYTGAETGGFLFDQRSGNTYTVNTTGAVLIPGLRAGATTEQLIGAVTEAFDVTANDARYDVEQFLKQLESAKVVEHA